MAGTRGGLRLSLFAVMCLVLVHCGNRPAPTNPTPVTPNLSAVVIEGLPATPTVGQTVQLTVKVALSDGTRKTVAEDQVTWESSAPSVANVSTAGFVTVMGSGEADIKARYLSQTGAAHLVVLAPPPVPPPTFEIT